MSLRKLISVQKLSCSARFLRHLALTTTMIWVNQGMAIDKQHFPQHAGFHDLQFTSAMGAMDLSLFLPATVNADTPLILVLHYAGQPTRYYGRPLLETLIQPAFAEVEDSPQALFVAPTSLGGDWRTKENMHAVFEMLEAVENHYATNPSRRVVTGYSMGAVGSWHLQSEKAGFFAAAIPIAGYPTRSGVACHSPVYAIMSNADEVFALAPFEQLTSTLEEQNAPIATEIVEGVGHYNIGGFQDAVSNAARWLSQLW